LAIQKLNTESLLLAYHDRSDGGLFATVCEMAFAGRCGATVSLDELVFEQSSDDVDGFKQAGSEQLAGRLRERALQAMFAEELGAVLQIRAADRNSGNGPSPFIRTRGLFPSRRTTQPERRSRIHARRQGGIQGSARRPAGAPGPRPAGACSSCATIRSARREEYDRILDTKDPGISFQLGYEIQNSYKGNSRPRIAILREQGVNSQVEMAAAFTRAGFEAVDVHMSDIIAGRTRLSDFKGLAACGGFSYGDVLGGGQGWAKSILFNARARKEFEAFFGRGDTLRAGVLQRLAR